MTLNIGMKSEVCGLFKIEAVKKDEEGNDIPGTRRVLADWFPNLITNAGLDRMANNAGWKQYCQVGSGSTTPAVTDTALSSRVAGTLTTITHETGSSAAAPWYGWSRVIKQFAAGVATGTLAEVGMGWALTGSLFSRALILDSGGSPTTITVLADEYLQVTYEFRQYAPTTDGTGTIVLGGVTYSYTSRAAVASGGEWRQTETGVQMGIPTGANVVRAYTGGIGAVTGTPSGTAVSIPAELSAYSAGTFASRNIITASPAQGILTGGIKSMLLGYSPPPQCGAYQIEFTPAIPKTSENQLSLTVSHSWARKTL